MFEGSIPTRGYELENGKPPRRRERYERPVDRLPPATDDPVRAAPGLETGLPHSNLTVSVCVLAPDSFVAPSGPFARRRGTAISPVRSHAKPVIDLLRRLRARNRVANL